MTNKNIIHIHVGKCAGSSINKALNQSRVEFVELHCGDSSNELNRLFEQDKGDNVYLISTRDPIKRFISAFNWDKYEKTVKNKTRNLEWIKIYDTFSSANHLAESLTSTDEKLRDYAEFVFTDSNLHIEFGLSWYISLEQASRFPKSRTFIVNTESLVSDYNFFCLNVLKNNLPVDALPKDKDSSGFLSLIEIDKPTYLSEIAIRNLKRQLEKDYSVGNLLAVNFSAYSL